VSGFDWVGSPQVAMNYDVVTTATNGSNLTAEIATAIAAN
jgi:hypothetical protein